METCVLYGIAPSRVETPANAPELAALLHQATAAGTALVPWGAGTQQSSGRIPMRYDLALRTTELRQFEKVGEGENCTLTVGAGLPLAEVQATLAKDGLWLPWDPAAAPQATIGGLLACNASGPYRFGFGTPRDWQPCLRVALGDGQLLEAHYQGEIPSPTNAAFHLGAFGALGVIVEATLKPQPRPACQRTLFLSFSDPYVTLESLKQLRLPPLEPVSLVSLDLGAAQAIPSLSEFLTGQTAAFLAIARFAGQKAQVLRQIYEATRRGIEVGARCVDLDERDNSTVWEEIANFKQITAAKESNAEISLLLQGSAPLPQMFYLAKTLSETAQEQNWRAAHLIYVGNREIYARWWLPAATSLSQLETTLAVLRATLTSPESYIFVDDAPIELRSQLDLWGSLPSNFEALRSFKAVCDPGAILNSGRYFI